MIILDKTRIMRVTVNNQLIQKRMVYLIIFYQLIITTLLYYYCYKDFFVMKKNLQKRTFLNVNFFCKFRDIACYLYKLNCS